MEENNKCSICGSDRCIGKFLLHPKEVRLFVPRIEETELAVCPDRTFHLVDSPPSGEIFTKFKELHVTAGPNEDLNNLPEVKVYVEDLIEKVREQDSLPADIDSSYNPLTMIPIRIGKKVVGYYDISSGVKTTTSNMPIDMSQFVGERDHPVPRIELPDPIDDPLQHFIDVSEARKEAIINRMRPTKKKYRRKKK